MSEEITPERMVEEIMEVAESVCTAWEYDFIQSLSEWEGDYTEKQIEVIKRIYQKACDSPY